MEIVDMGYVTGFMKDLVAGCEGSKCRAAAHPPRDRIALEVNGNSMYLVEPYKTHG
jgi:hypothetical protein